MKYNNGDMDDLFRRASEGYPLRTDSADWDRLAGALDGVPEAPSDQEEKRRRRGVFWWFLLIPLAGVGYLTWQASGNHSMKREITVAPRVGGAVAPGVGGTAGQAGNGLARTGEAQNGLASGEEVRKPRTRDQGRTVAGDVPGSGIGVDSAREVVRGKVRSLRTLGNGGSNVGGADVEGSNAGGVDIVGSSVVGSKRGAKVGGIDHDAVLALLDLRRAPIGGGYNVVVDVKAPKAADNPVRKAKHSHGYIGVLGAPDLSTVHFQSMKGAGTTFGVLLGYAFNDRWAVETGLYLDRKNYYTAGEYFKKEMPAGYTLQNVDGTCNMLEIPVNVRYNFNTSQRMRWFATAGLSTYLMSKENYTYQYEYNWTTGDSSWDIHKPSQYWFSIINLSAGFEQHIGKIGNLRLEPYVRIPLSGIGTGKLPILSAGLNIGFTHQLW
jgi:hypothetical protein